MAIDPLLQRFLNQQQQGPVTSYDPVSQYRAAVASAQRHAATTPRGDGLDAARAYAQRQKDAPSGGSGGGYGLGKVVGAPFKALDMVGNLAPSLIQELGDSLAGRGGSWSDFVDQVNDSEFGFGTVVGDITDNKWINRGIGLFGDLALDPTTYLGLGAGKYIGQSGRAAAAANLRKAGFGQEVIERVGKYGVAAASGAEREALNLGRQGVTFAGARIPGSGKVAEAVGGGLSKARVGLGANAVGDAARTRIGAKELVDARQALAGRPSLLNAVEAADRFRVSDAERVGRMWQNAFSTQAARDFKGLDDGIRRKLTEAVELGLDVPEAEIFSIVRKWAVGEGLPVGELGDYVPHVRTSGMRKFFANDPDATKIFIDDVGASGRTRSRTLSGKRTLKGKEITFSDNPTIAEINEKLTAAFPEAGITKWYEDDLAKLADVYINNITADVAKRQGLDEVAVLKSELMDQVDPKATRKATEAAQKGAVKDARKARDVAVKDVKKSTDSLADLFDSTRVAARGAVPKAQGRFDEAAVGARGGAEAARTARDEAYSARRSAADRVARSEKKAAKLEGELKELRRKKVRGIADKKVELDAQRQLHDQLLVDADATNAAWEASRMAVKDADMAVKDADRALSGLERLSRTLNRKSPKQAADVAKYADDLDSVLQQLPNDPDLQPIADMLTVASRQAADIERKGWTVDATKAFLKDAKDGRVAPVVKHMLRDGFSEIGEGLFAEGEERVITQALARSMNRVEEEVSKSAFWTLFDGMTQFFKTYATLSPGFHVRNLMGASFMNFSDGVGVKEMGKSFGLWKQYRKDPVKFLTEHEGTDIGNAFKMVFGSGAGGGVSVDELYGELGIGGLGKLTDNAAVRLGRHAGEWVEGPVRLAMALDSVARGDNVTAGVARITRIHFDYSQLSNFDRYAKRLIPFWTFMSRNLPMQVQQIALKPKAYAQYEHFVNNASEERDDLVPLYWIEGGAFKVGGDKYLMPDLQHTNLLEDISKLDPRDPLRLLSEANPIVRVPAEFAVGKKFFYDSEFRDDESKLEYLLEALVPTIGQAERVSGNDLLNLDGEDYDATSRLEDRRLQSILGYFGTPVKQLTEGQQQAEQRRRNYSN